MQVTTTISLPKNLSEEVEKEIKTGRFSSRSEFFRSAVRTFLNLQEGKMSWEILATPFRNYAKESGMKKEDILRVVEEGRGKRSKSSD